MGKINDAIVAAKGGNIEELLAVAMDLPDNGEATSDYDQDGVPPGNEEGESMNTITAAYFAGDLTPEQYKSVVKVAQAAAKPNKVQTAPPA